MSGARIGILISGGGRTALNIHAACTSGQIDGRVAIVVAHREEADGVARCREAGLRVAVIPPDDRLPGSVPGSLADRIDEVLGAARIDLLCLAGYLRKFRVGERWRGRTLNIHPALLPEFGGHGMYGIHVHRAVLAAMRTESGCTVHEVDEEYDHGRTVLVRKCPVLANDSPETLAARVFTEECAAYPEAIRLTLARMQMRRAEVHA